MENQNSLKINTIVFDMLGVLLEDAYQHIFKEIEKTENITPNSFITQIRSDLDDTLKGKISELELFEKIIKKFNLKINPNELYQKVMEGFIKIDGTWEILKKLKEKNYNLIILSNMSHNYVEEKMQKLELEKYFNEIYFSSEVGWKKPQIEFFEHILNKENLKSEECLFIDDKERNILTYEKIGIKGIIFENPKQLEIELIKLKLL
ncbi:MAG: HAD-IA family hydrolase [Nanoarchaeota archaeon]|nr:HAD-IA family hydrolase [Nanoarchaeota archaeon]